MESKFKSTTKFDEPNRVRDSNKFEAKFGTTADSKFEKRHKKEVKCLMRF
ncbi:hypothetical protein [uncultured Campylobacter sp.]